MERKRLGDRRNNQTFEVLAGTPEIGVMKWIVTVGRWGKLGMGKLAEIFIASGKSGSHMNIMALELSTITSIALQYGAPVDVIRNAMPRNDRGEPEGIIGALFDQIHHQETELKREADAVATMKIAAE